MATSDAPVEVFKGAYALRLPAGWAQLDGHDCGPWTEVFAAAAPARARLLVSRKARFASLTGTPGAGPAARLERFVDAQEAPVARAERAAPYGGRVGAAFAAAAAADYATTRAVLLEAADEDVVVRLVDGVRDDLAAVVASLDAAARPPACACCGKTAAPLRRCARCHDALYCSRACQTLHWKMGHKAACAPRAPPCR